MALDLWQAHFQILSIVFLKEFVKFSANTGMMIKNVQSVELNNYCDCFLNTKTLRMI